MTLVRIHAAAAMLLSASSLAAAPLALPRQPDLPLAADIPFKPSPKRGVGHYSSPRLGHSWGLSAKAVDELKLGWYYNWMAKPMPSDEGVKAEFVPMAWDEEHVGESELAAAKALKPKALLGFNEPDNEGQAEMSPEECLKLWPKLEATGLRLGSPSPAHAEWLHGFMREAKKRGLRVDFLALHNYPDIGEPDAIEGLRAFVREYWKAYQIPIWLTEFSAADWKFYKHAASMADNARFARDSCLLLDSLPFVERYAWFSTGPGAREGRGMGGYAPTCLYVKPGELAPAGVAYRDAMLRPDLGLRFRVYAGDWKAFPERAGLTPTAEGRTVGFDLWPDASADAAAIDYEGYLQVAQGGHYSFHLYDRDSALELGGKSLLQAEAGWDKDLAASADLAPGRHRIRVSTLRRPGHARLRLAMEGPGLPLQSLPLDALFLPEAGK